MKQLQKMSETERKIMELVWQAAPPGTVSEIQLMAGDVKAGKHTTIATFLQNLCQKGVLRVVKKGNTNLYFNDSQTNKNLLKAYYIAHVKQSALRLF